MNKTKPIEDFERRIVMNQIASCLPSDLKTKLLAYHLSKPPHKYKGPSRRSEFLADLVFTGSVLSGEPASLELENRRLTEGNQNQASASKDALEESSRAQEKLSRDYECKIKEAEQKCIKREEELNAELERMRATIGSISHGQGMLKRAYGELFSSTLIHGTSCWAHSHICSEEGVHRDSGNSV